jgi:hypothetical protein
VDFSQARPDFRIPSQGLNIETTIASNTQATQPESLRLGKTRPHDFNAFNLFRCVHTVLDRMLETAIPSVMRQPRRP